MRLALIALGLGLVGTVQAQPWPGVAEPSMRIGLSLQDDRVVSLGGRSGFHIVDADSGETPWLPRYSGEVRIVRLGGGKAREIYRVQVGSFSDESAANALATRLQVDIGERASVHYDSQRRVYRVRIGEHDSRIAAGPLARRLNEKGFPDAWISSELEGDDSGVQLRIVDRDFQESIIGRRKLRVWPAGRSLLSVNGARYRGQVEIFVDQAGQMRVVNIVNLEDYLRGVVPKELGPGVYPELEALKAQTVAARTYAVKNRGQFSDEGFDICDSPRCQVYGGADAEHPLTDRAIAQTGGEVLTHQGGLVNAMFTSTCGGHTENVENVFPEQAEPYLRAVPCSPEAEGRAGVVDQIAGGAPLTHLPAELARWTARLAVAGVLDLESLAEPQRRVDLRTWNLWLSRAAPLLGRTKPSLPDQRGALSRGRLAADVVTTLDWQERGDRLLAGSDAAVILGLSPGAGIPAEVHAAGGSAVALLVRDGILAPEGGPVPDGLAEPMSVAGVVSVLGRLLDRYGPDLVQEIRVGSAAPGSLTTRQGRRLAVAEGPFLFAATAAGTSPTPVLRLAVTRNEPVRVHLDAEGKVDYVEALRAFRSLSDDRFSSRLTWEKKKTLDALSERLSTFLSFGKLVDLQVVSRGPSGRVVQLDVVGTAGRPRLTGFDVRVALQLDESLFTIERIRAAGGAIREFVFAGKGWGHGIGMCQVGAFGMAVRGRSYRDILLHYYSDVSLVSLRANPSLLDTSAVSSLR